MRNDSEQRLDVPTGIRNVGSTELDTVELFNSFNNDSKYFPLRYS